MGTEPTVGADIRKQFMDAGFKVGESGERPTTMVVKKNNCLRSLERNAAGEWAPVGPPHFIVRGLSCELEDRGYQKFWYDNGKRFPIRKTDLETLHRFDEEVRYLLALRTLYHESLGSTCARTVYDRLTGRPDK